MKDIHGVKQYTIYGLADPDTQEVRYIGRTSRALSLRVAGHVSAARSGSMQMVAMWVRSLLYAGKRPLIVPLHSEECGKERAIRIEAYFIRQHKEAGAYLFNVAPAF